MENLAEAVTDIAGMIMVIGIVFTIVWRMNVKEKEKRETLRFLLERGHDLDHPEIRKLLENKPMPMEANPGDAYRGFLIGGVMCIVVGFGLGIMLAIIGSFEHEQETIGAGLGIGVLLNFIGAGMIICTRFLSKPEKPRQD